MHIYIHWMRKSMLSCPSRHGLENYLVAAAVKGVEAKRCPLFLILLNGITSAIFFYPFFSSVSPSFFVSSLLTFFFIFFQFLNIFSFFVSFFLSFRVISFSPYFSSFSIIHFYSFPFLFLIFLLSQSLMAECMRK